MAIVSSPVAAGQDVLAIQYNNLRKDLVDNHTHTDAGGEGGVISHGDLTDGAVGGTGITHENIDKHITGDLPGVFADDPGGNAGVHGLVASAYIAGVAGTVAQAQGDPAGPTLTAGQLVIVAGTFTLTTWSEEETIDFGITFSTAPIVVCCPMTASKTAGDWFAHPELGEITTTDFKVRLWCTDRVTVVPQVSWIAIGVKA